MEENAIVHTITTRFLLSLFAQHVSLPANNALVRALTIALNAILMFNDFYHLQEPVIALPLTLIMVLTYSVKSAIIAASHVSHHLASLAQPVT